MSHKTFLATTALFFALAFVIHVLRLVYGWEVVIGGWTVPTWFSWIGIVVAGFLSWTAFKARK